MEIDRQSSPLPNVLSRGSSRRKRQAPSIGRASNEQDLGSVRARGFSMTTKYSEERPDEVSRFSVSTSAEVTIQIAEREGHQFIVIKEQHPAGTISTTEQTIEIPAALLPELKRAVAVLEENFGDGDEPEPP